MATAEAKAILESLVKAQQGSAADKLRERVVQCEAADVLAKQDFVNMSTDSLQKLLKATQYSWKKFSLEIKFKLCRHRAHHLLSEKPASNSLALVAEFCDFGGVNFNEDRNDFAVLEACFPDFLHDFVWAAHDIMKANKLLETDADGEEVLQIGFESVPQQDAKHKAVSENAALLKLKEMADETWT